MIAIIDPIRPLESVSLARVVALGVAARSGGKLQVREFEMNEINELQTATNADPR